MGTSFASPVGRALVAVVLLGLAVGTTSAQNAAAIVTTVSTAPSSGSSPSGPKEKDIVADLLADQRAIWTSPLHVRKKDATWLIPAAAIAATLVATDRHVSGEVAESDTPIAPSRRISYLGSGATLFAAAGTTYAVGLFAHDERARATGLLAVEALIDESVVVAALKQATNRERPDKVTGHQDFYDGGTAFPSGHAAASWAFAEVVAEQYRDVPLVRWSAYGVATAVSIARVTERKHSPSDVFVGGLIGYLIGRHVAQRGAATGTTSRLTVAPLADPSTRTFGLEATLSF